MFKIVYVHICDGDDRYNHMLHISLASVRRHMPEISVCIATDSRTAAFFRESGDSILQDSHTEILEIDCPEKYTQKERSRFIKTGLRMLIQGDFLYTDVDTVFCKDISNEPFPASVCMVLDRFMTFTRKDYPASTLNLLEKWGVQVTDGSNYYNGGVIMAKDDEPARLLFEKWHELWISAETPECCVDQPSLYKVNQALNIIHALDGTWNTMLFFYPNCLIYLMNAKILHYFTGPHSLAYPLNDPKILLKDIQDPEIQKILAEPKTAFLLNYDNHPAKKDKFTTTDFYKRASELYRSSRKTFCVADKLVKWCYMVYKLLLKWLAKA